MSLYPGLVILFLWLYLLKKVWSKLYSIAKKRKCKKENHCKRVEDPEHKKKNHCKRVEDPEQKSTEYELPDYEFDISNFIESADEEQVDVLQNDRMSWGKGFSVEVYSNSDEAWFQGQVIEVVGVSQKRKVRVVYNGKMKWISVFSRELRPLLSSSELNTNKSFHRVLQDAHTLLNEHNPKIEPIVWDAFVSYSQTDSQDAVGLLYWLLKSRGVTIWFDHQLEDISVSGMSSGISKSRVFVIFLSRSYFNRVFPVFELETALLQKKEILVVWEADERCGGHSNFKSYLEACPKKYKAKLFEKEAIRFERRGHLQEAQMDVLAKRILQAQTNASSPVQL